MKKHAMAAFWITCLGLWLASAVLGFAQSSPSKDNEATVQQKFVSDGSIRLHMEAGDYTVEGTDSTDIVVTYSAKDAEHLKNIHVNFKTSGSNAEVWVKNTPHNDFHATIQVPHKSHLWIRLSAGDLDIKGIEGDKDVALRAGDLDIEIARPEDYGHREASVTAGSIDASAFNVSKDGLWRSFKQDGPGKYSIRVHLYAGDITLRRTS
ncbi:MAG TPA: hypothetical protein VH437_18360 [Terriglobales bacterium]|jgi:hypothetical protein